MPLIIPPPVLSEFHLSRRRKAERAGRIESSARRVVQFRPHLERAECRCCWSLLLRALNEEAR